MTDEPELSPAEEQAVSELLADVSAELDRTLPDEVAARLDARLAELTTELTTEGVVPRPAEVPHDIAPVAQLRPRRWPRALLAAAAVAVGGFAVVNVVDRSAQVASDSAGAADGGGVESSREESASADDAQGEGDGITAGGERPDELAPEALRDGKTWDTAAMGAFLAVDVPPRVRSDHLEQDVRRVVAAVRADDLVLWPADEAASCEMPPSARRGVWLVVRYDGTRATLVLTTPEDGPADPPLLGRIYTCTAPSLLDRVELPAS